MGEAYKIELSGVILAGGESRRMGRDKRFLQINGRPLLSWVQARLQSLVDEVIVVTRHAHDLPQCSAPIVTDIFPGRGVLAGVHAGLSAAHSQWALVVAGDMPLLNLTLWQEMIHVAHTSQADIIVPRYKGKLEPLHALYRPATCAPAAEAALQRGQRRIISFYPRVRVLTLYESWITRWDPTGSSFTNVNTPEEWENLQHQLHEGS